MTALDIITFLLVGIAAAFGFKNGFVQEIVSLIAWVLALIAVKLFEPSVAAVLTPHIGTQAGATVLSFALVFGATFILGKMLASSLGRSSRKSLIGPVDRLLGLGFGALKGLLGAAILFLIMTLGIDTYDGGDTPRPTWLTESRSYPLLAASSDTLVGFVKARRKHHPLVETAPEADNSI